MKSSPETHGHGGSLVGDPMARHTSTNDLPIKNLKSPKGFWPNPDEEMFYKARTPPGKYQTGGKAGGEQKSSIMIYQKKILYGKIVGN